MYCKACGKLIKPGITQCPYCGKDAGALSGGTGFWDLIEKPVERLTTEDSPQTQISGKVLGKAHSLRSGLTVLLFIILVIQIICMFYLISLCNKMTQMETSVIEQESTQENMKDDIAEIMSSVTDQMDAQENMEAEFNSKLDLLDESLSGVLNLLGMNIGLEENSPTASDWRNTEVGEKNTSDNDVPLLAGYERGNDAFTNEDYDNDIGQNEKVSTEPGSNSISSIDGFIG